jgi:'Paired box' domain
MGRPYSDDLRERVVAAIESGYTRKEVAELFNMALSTVGGFIRRKRETGSVGPDKFGGFKATVPRNGSGMTGTKIRSRQGFPRVLGAHSTERRVGLLCPAASVRLNEPKIFVRRKITSAEFWRSQKCSILPSK